MCPAELSVGENFWQSAGEPVRRLIWSRAIHPYLVLSAATVVHAIATSE